jgi:uncharacterized protein YecA (UPF0149 family)
MRIMANLLRQGRWADEIMLMQSPPDAPHATAGAKVGRNDSCPCGSGKKFKHCHAGAIVGAAAGAGR